MDLIEIRKDNLSEDITFKKWFGHVLQKRFPELFHKFTGKDFSRNLVLTKLEM